MVTFYNIHSQHKKYDNYCKLFLLSLAIYIKWHSYRYTLTHTYIKNYLRSLLVSQGYLFQSKNPHTTRNNNFKQQQWQWEKKIKSQNISIVNKVWKSLKQIREKKFNCWDFFLSMKICLHFDCHFNHTYFSWLRSTHDFHEWNQIWIENLVIILKTKQNHVYNLILNRNNF